MRIISFLAKREILINIPLLVLIVGMAAGIQENMFIRLNGLLFFILIGRICVRIFFQPHQNILLTPLAVIIPLTISGTLLYLFYRLNTLAISLSLILFSSAILFLERYTASAHPSQPTENSAMSSSSNRVFFFFAAILIFIIGYIGAFNALISSATREVVLGPWALASASFFVFFVLAAAGIFFLAYIGNARTVLVILACFFFLGFNVTTLLFPLGFGFDPFLHQATERIILEQGFIEPRTFYYIGHYVVVTIIAKLFAVDISTLDTFLVPTLAALSLPTLLYVAVRKKYKNHLSKACCLLGVLFFSAIPFSFFTMTTPWALAYSMVFFLILSSLSQGVHTRQSLLSCGMLCLAALFIHPLAGLPAFCFFIFLFLEYIYNCSEKRKKFISYARPCIFAIAGSVVPLAFYINSMLSTQFPLLFKFPSLEGTIGFLKLFMPSFETNYTFLLDIVYGVGNNGFFLLLIMALIGALLIQKKGGAAPFLPYLYGWGITIINAFFLYEMMHFPSLINYERSEYAERLILLSFIFLAPFIAHTLLVVLRIVFHETQKSLVRFVFALLFLSFVPASLYLSYPRNDAYASFHGFNVSSADVETVKKIHVDSRGEPYIVLSNQVVAAAAVKELGFLAYYQTKRNARKESIFFYPIPTSSPLHAFYTNMKKNPSRRTIEKAMELVGVQRAYFVANSYDERFPIIVESAKKEATAWYYIQDNKNAVFLYKEQK